MRRVFIADAHLRKPTDYNYQLLIRFLAELRGATDTLFILGDLFEFWVGYGYQEFPHYRPVLDALRELSESGTQIIYFEGNHDFHLNGCFSENLSATIHPKPARVNLDGMQVFMCHGDQVNSRDYGYRFLRFLLHSQPSITLFRLVPPRLVFRIAEYLSSRSKTCHRERNMKWDYKALVADFAEQRFREGCDAVVTAHFHLPYLSVTDDGKTILSLGDWISQFSYGELRDGRFSLHTYRIPDQHRH